MSQYDLSLLARRRGPDPSRQPPRPHPLLELIEVRRLFEPATAALAAARVTDTDLADFAARLEVMAGARDDPVAFAAHDVAFHQAVTSVTRNETLMNLLDAVSTHTLLAEFPGASSITTQRKSSSPSTLPSTPPSKHAIRRSPTRPPSST